MLRMLGRELHSNYGPTADTGGLMQNHAPTIYAYSTVEALLEGLAAESKGKSNWKYSIVDLMTLLDMDSSLSERKELAKELGYTGSTDDSATMNIWLHKQVIKKLAENGGKVPADLLD